MDPIENPTPFQRSLCRAVGNGNVSRVRGLVDQNSNRPYNLLKGLTVKWNVIET